MLRLVFLMSCLLIVPAYASAEPVIVVLGDSLSAGYGLQRGQSWVNLLQSRLAQQGYKHRVINASISGETTGGGLTRLPRVLSTHHPELLLIVLGANDGLRGLSTKQMQSNLTQMVQLAGQAGANSILVGMQIPPNYGPVYTRQFTQTFQSVSDQYKIRLVPFLLDGIADKLEFFLPDRLHPTAQAQPFLLENVWPEVRRAIQPPESSTNIGMQGFSLTSSAHQPPTIQR